MCMEECPLKCRLMTHGIPRQRAYPPQPAGRLSAQIFDHTAPICKGSVSLGMSRVSDLGWCRKQKRPFRFLQEFGISSTQVCEIREGIHIQERKCGKDEPGCLVFGIVVSISLQAKSLCHHMLPGRCGNSSTPLPIGGICGNQVSKLKRKGGYGKAENGSSSDIGTMLEVLSLWNMRTWVKLLSVDSLGCYSQNVQSHLYRSVSVLGHAWLASLSRFLFVIAMKAATAQTLHLLSFATFAGRESYAEEVQGNKRS